MIERMATVPLAWLLPDPAVNARTTDMTEALDEMAASIAAVGVLEPLLCRPGANEEELLVVDGERRRKALCKYYSDVPHAQVWVNVVVREMSDSEAREASLAANIVRLALHPIDQFEAFSAQAEAGRAAEEIALRFGVAPRIVRQRIALGALHPDIRAAWRAGKLGAGDAQAFTLARDPMHQRAVFVELETKGNLYSSHIRAALGANHSVSAALKFVGLEAYRAAGGEAIEDLFGGADALSDPGLAQRLANDRLNAECKRLVGEGWSFAVLRAATPQPWLWTRLKPSGSAKLSEADAAQKAALEHIASRMKDEDGDDADFDVLDPDRQTEVAALCAKLDPPIVDELSDAWDIMQARVAAIDEAAERNAFGPRQKKTAGCMVDIDGAGALQVTYGVQRPEEQKKPAKGAKAAPAAEPEDDEDAGRAAPGAPEEAAPAISAALCLALSQQRTIAAAKALTQDPELALCALIAALETHGDTGVKLSANGYYGARQAVAVDAPTATGFDRFAAQLARLEVLDTPERMERLAPLVAGALDLQRHHPSARASDAEALVAMLDREDFEREALEVFDAKAYFTSVSAALCVKAADELGIPAKGRPKKKADLAAALTDKAKTEAWLPLELRHPHGGARASVAAKPTLAEEMAKALDADSKEAAE